MTDELDFDKEAPEHIRRINYLDYRLLEIIACPICKGKLFYYKDRQELICKLDKVAYPIRNGIPILLEIEARLLSTRD